MCQESGEQYFAPVSVERIGAIIRNLHKPDNIIETPVYEFA